MRYNYNYVTICENIVPSTSSQKVLNKYRSIQDRVYMIRYVPYMQRQLTDIGRK
jgi:hypothetical protein